MEVMPMTAIITESRTKINEETAAEIKAERAAKTQARQAGLVADLLELAEGSQKVKGYDTYQAQTVKFYNGQIFEIEVAPEVYEAFEKELKGSGWKLTPQATSGGFIAKRGASNV